MFKHLIFILIASMSISYAADKVEITSTSLGHGLYMVQGRGGNIGLSTGQDGIYLIDDQFAPISPAIKQHINTLQTGQVKFIINTHWHGDHTGGNKNFADDGALIIAHDNVRKRMSKEQFMEFLNSKVPASPVEALPVITFTQQMSLHLNQLDAQIIHIKQAHTDGDAFVVFKKANVIHMGDVLFAGMYPFIDLSSGGSIDGYIAGLKQTLNYMDDQTKVIPGHGPLTDKHEVVAMLAMLNDVRSRIADAKNAGKSLEQVIALKPTQAYDKKRNHGWIKADQLVEFIYKSI
ncbi:MAG: MBL fold metallo-hydrolase [bacterium]